MLNKACIPSNFAWKSNFCDVYSSIQKDGTKKTIFRYRFPLEPEQERELFLRLRLAEADRTVYYQKLAAAVQNQFAASVYLKKQDIASLLYFTQVERETDKQVSYVYLATEEIVPLSQVWNGKTDTLKVVTLLYRLATILRDLNQISPPVAHRGISFDDIYVTPDRRFLLGGFFYTVWQDDQSPPAYVPGRPHNLTRIHQMGRIGESYDDVYTLAALAWTIFSGCPIGSELPPAPLPYPMYAPEEAAAAITTGLSCLPESLQEFRKGISHCRKGLLNGKIQNQEIPLCRPYHSIYVEDPDSYNKI